MAFGLGGSGGENGTFNAIVKYNAKDGRVYRVDRSDDGAGNYSNDEVEIGLGDFVAIYDFDNLDIGYMRFIVGQMPDFKMVKYGEPPPLQPVEVDAAGKKTYKAGFRVMIALGKTARADGVSVDIRELASTARCVVDPMDKIHKAYLDEREKHPGQLPLIKLVKTVKTAGKGGDQNHSPVFEIERWVNRPPELGGEGIAAKTEAPPPPPKPAPAREMASDEEF